VVIPDSLLFKFVIFDTPAALYLCVQNEIITIITVMVVPGLFMTSDR